MTFSPPRPAGNLEIGFDYPRFAPGGGGEWTAFGAVPILRPHPDEAMLQRHRSTTSVPVMPGWYLQM